MNCNQSGKTFVVSLTTVPGSTAANANYMLSIDHHLCFGRKICTQEVFPVTADVKFTPLAAPVLLGNGTYCVEVLVSGTVTYVPYNCGCEQCPCQDQLYTTVCIPCSSATMPTLTPGTPVAAPTNVKPCCNVTNAVAITTTINVTTA